MQGTGKMSPVAGLFSEVQDEVLTDCVFEAMVRKDGSVRLGDKAGLGSAVRDGGPLAGGVLSGTGLAGEAPGGAAAIISSSIPCIPLAIITHGWLVLSPEGGP